MMKKNCLNILLMFLLMGLFLSCAGERKKIVAVSQCSMDEWRNQMNEEMLREAFFHTDLDVEIHSTPDNFGAENSQAIVGLQMANAYVGSMLAPPLFGFLSKFMGMGLYPFYLLAFALLMLVMTEVLAKRVNDRG